MDDLHHYWATVMGPMKREPAASAAESFLPCNGLEGAARLSSRSGPVTSDVSDLIVLNCCLCVCDRLTGPKKESIREMFDWFGEEGWLGF